MTNLEYSTIESYMKTQMQDVAHDPHHVYRVLNAAIDIANHENGACTDVQAPSGIQNQVDISVLKTNCSPVDTNVLIAACLLHDIGREQQAADPKLCHAQIGSEMAYDFLLSLNWPRSKARHVKECIRAHRYRSEAPPESIEAKILFDADKLEACGAIGIARTLIYQGQVLAPLYSLDDEGKIITLGGEKQYKSSFFQEYNFKLANVYGTFFTARAKEIATRRQKAAFDFYNSLYDEISTTHSSLYQYAIIEEDYFGML